MDRKYKFDLIKKNTRIVAPLMQKFMMVLAICVMMTTTVHAGAFLSKTGVATNDLPTGYLVINNKRTMNDTWDDAGGFIADDDAYTGLYIGTFNKNSNPWNGNPDYEDFKVLISAFLFPDTVSFEGYGKKDDSSLEVKDEVTNLEINYEYGIDGNAHTGTWDVTTSDGSNNINFYGVKKAGDFALYYIDEEGASNGVYTTAHVHNGNVAEDLSNFQVVKITIPDIPGNPPVPEPATMLLFGFSLIGLAGVARRQNGRF